MQRSWVERALSALLAVWFVFVTIEPAALHSCPMHGTHVTHAAGHAPAASPTGGHHGHAVAATDAATDDAPVAAQHCTCLGTAPASR